MIERIDNSKKGIVVVFVIVVVVIIASFYIFGMTHKDDPYLSATLYYRYLPGTGASVPTVHVWGEVYNWGAETGKGRLTVIITDDEGHKMSDTIEVGQVPPHLGVSVDKTYQWNHVYDQTEHPIAPVVVSYHL